MIGRKGYGDKDEILMTFLDVRHYGVLGLSAEPGGGADLRLPAKAVGVGEAEALHDGVDCRPDFGRIRVTWGIED